MTPRAPLDHPPARPTSLSGDPWCGHRDGYTVSAYLCGRPSASDQIVRYQTCDREYLASELGVHLRKDDAPAMPAPPNAKPPERERKPVPATTYKDIGPGSVSGNLTADPVLRYTPAGRAVATLRVAETERVYDQDSDRWVDLEPNFYDVIAWGNQGEHTIDALAKADRIVAVGRWQEQTWTGDDGQERTSTVLVARDVGPSLLFNKATVSRPERRRGGK